MEIVKGKGRIDKRIMTIIILTATVCLSIAHLAGIAGIEGRFTFNPPNGASFTEKTLEQMVTTDSVGKQVTQWLETKTRICLTKQKTGYTLDKTLLTYTLKRNGQLSEDSFLTTLQGETLRYACDDTGLPLTVQGVEKLIQKLKEKYPSTSPGDEANFLETITDQMVLSWQTAVSNLVGESYFIGGICFISHMCSLPGYPNVPTYYAYEISEKANYGGNKCLKINYRFDTDPTRLLKEYGIKPGETAIFKGEKKVSGIEIKAKGNRIQDPQTMLIYAQSGEELVQVFQQGNAQPILTRQRKIQTVYDYSK